MVWKLIVLSITNVDEYWFGVACDESKVYATSFGGKQQAVLSSLLDCLPFDAPFEVSSKKSILAEKVLVAIRDVYYGKGFSEEFSWATQNLSMYDRRVLEVTAKIPVGYVASYGAVAKTAGGSARSVGGVMARNPFAPIVPCHRVVQSDFKLGGYGGGLALKTEMLVREKRGYTSFREISVADKKLRIFPVEFVLSRLEKEKKR